MSRPLAVLLAFAAVGAVGESRSFDLCDAEPPSPIKLPFALLPRAAASLGARSLVRVLAKRALDSKKNGLDFFKIRNVSALGQPGSSPLCSRQI